MRSVATSAVGGVVLDGFEPCVACVTTAAVERAVAIGFVVVVTSSTAAEISTRSREARSRCC